MADEEVDIDDDVVGPSDDTDDPSDGIVSCDDTPDDEDVPIWPDAEVMVKSYDVSPMPCEDSLCVESSVDPTS